MRIGPSAARASGTVSIIAAATAAESALRILPSLQAGLRPLLSSTPTAKVAQPVESGGLCQRGLGAEF